MSEAEVPFRPREKLLEKQKHFQSIHKHTYLKGPVDKITSVAIPIALAASSLYLIVSVLLCAIIYQENLNGITFSLSVVM